MNDDKNSVFNMVLGIILSLGFMYILALMMVDDIPEFNNKVFQFIKVLLGIICILAIGGVLINFSEFRNWLKKPLNRVLFEDGQLYKQLKIDEIIESKTNLNLEIGSIYVLKGEIGNLNYEKSVPQSYYYKATEYFEWANHNISKLRKEDRLRVDNEGARYEN